METKFDLGVVCPECDSPEVIRDATTGELICSRCGLVLQRRNMYRGPDWGFKPTKPGIFTKRTGSPIKFSNSDKGLSTIMKLDRDAHGNPLSPETKQQMWRLRRWNYRYQMNQKERNLKQAMNELQRLSEKLKVPSYVQETAAIIYRKALDANIVMGRSIPAVVASSLYAACRLAETPKTIKEIVAASPRSRKQIARCYRLILEMLSIRMPIHDPAEYVSRIAEEAKISGDVEGLAFKILKEAKHKHFTTGKDPMGIAAATLYIASKLSQKRISQKEIAQAANITEVTVRNRKNELVSKLNIELYNDNQL